MTEDGIWGIIKRGSAYEVRYASYDLHGMDRLPYQCPNEGPLITLLRHYGLAPWYSNQAGAEWQKGGLLCPLP